MAIAGKKITEYASLGSPSGNTRLVVDHNGNTYQMNVATLFNNCSANLEVNTLVIKTSNTPASDGITVKKGTLFYDNNYVYVAIANNLLKRIAFEPGSF